MNRILSQAAISEPEGMNRLKECRKCRGLNDIFVVSNIMPICRCSSIAKKTPHLDVILRVPKHFQHALK
jgi:hypothetical protein